MKAWGLLAGLLLAVGAVTSAVAGGEEPSLEGIIQPDLSGRYVRLADLAYPGEEKPRHPRGVLVLNFMASWCEPCQRELPQLLAVWREYKAKGVRLVLLSNDSLQDKSSLVKLVEKMGIECDVLLDPYRLAAKRFGIEGIPHTLVFSREGQLKSRAEGAKPDFETWLRSALDTALDAKP